MARSSTTNFYKMDYLPIPMQAQQEKHMDYDQIELRNKAVSLIVEVYFGAGHTIDAQRLTAEAEVVYQWLLNGAKAAPDENPAVPA